jgi:hypothetical protein
MVGQSERLPMMIATGGVAVGIGDDFPRGDGAYRDRESRAL